MTANLSLYMLCCHLFFSQGFIAGPSGFAGGVARGVKSLLGHVIGILEDK